jgi:hypothetical protein
MREKGITVKDGEMLDKRALMQREFERKAREQNEFEAKMNKLARNMDYLERARREEELPYLEEAMRVRAAEQQTYFEAEQKALLLRHREKWDADIAAKHRSSHLAQDKCAPALLRLRRCELRLRFHAHLVDLLCLAHTRTTCGDLGSRRLLQWHPDFQLPAEYPGPAHTLGDTQRASCPQAVPVHS